jgi:hypothetical protein
MTPSLTHTQNGNTSVFRDEQLPTNHSFDEFFGNLLVFREQRAHGFDVWQDPCVELRLPKIFNLRMDPFERMDHEGSGYDQWRAEHLFLLVPAIV